MNIIPLATAWIVLPSIESVADATEYKIHSVTKYPRMVIIPETIVIEIVCLHSILDFLQKNTKGKAFRNFITAVGIDQIAKPEIMSANAPPKAPATMQ